MMDFSSESCLNPGESDLKLPTESYKIHDIVIHGSNIQIEIQEIQSVIRKCEMEMVHLANAVKEGSKALCMACTRFTGLDISKENNLIGHQRALSIDHGSDLLKGHKIHLQRYAIVLIRMCRLFLESEMHKQSTQSIWAFGSCLCLSESGLNLQIAMCLNNCMTEWASLVERDDMAAPKRNISSALPATVEDNTSNDYIDSQWVLLIAQLREVGYDSAQLIAAGATIATLRESGFGAREVSIALYNSIDWSSMVLVTANSTHGPELKMSSDEPCSIPLDTLVESLHSDVNQMVPTQDRWATIVQHLWVGTYTIKEIETAFSGGILSRARAVNTEAREYLRQCTRKDFTYVLAVDRARERHSSSSPSFSSSQVKADLTVFDLDNLTSDAITREPETPKSNAVVTTKHRLSRIDRVELWDRPDPYGRTPLWWACFQNHPIIAKYLIERGCDVNPTDKVSFETPLMATARYGHPSLARVIVNAGGNLGAIDKEGHTALHIAAMKSIVSKQTSSSLVITDAMHRDIMRGQTGVAHVLLTNGAKADVLDKYKRTALHYAAMKGHAVLITILCKWGNADLDLADCNDETPLMLAVKTRATDAVGVLIRMGANPGHVGGRLGESTALLLACFLGDLELVTLILSSELPVDIGAPNASGVTPLHYACRGIASRAKPCRRGHDASILTSPDHKSTAALQSDLTFLESLLARGMNASLVSRQGQTVLHELCGSNLIDCNVKPASSDLSFLVSKGYVREGNFTPDFERIYDTDGCAEYDGTDSAQKLHPTENMKYIEAVLETLIRSGVRLDATANDGSTALAWAAAHACHILRRQSVDDVSISEDELMASFEVEMFKSMVRSYGSNK